MLRKYKVEFISEIECETIAEGQQKTRESFKMLSPEVKPLKSIRSLRQNASIHKWCELVEEHCKERGFTLDVLYKKPFEVPINRHYLKDFFREVGRIMFHKDSTAKLETNECSEVVKVVEKAWAERLESDIPFPSIYTQMNDDDFNS
jgi:hypothetical protein